MFKEKPFNELEKSSPCDYSPNSPSKDSLEKLLGSSSVLDYFSFLCRRYKDSIAIETETMSYSYGQLELWSDQLSHHLVNFSDKKLIAISMDKSVDFIIAILASLKANFSYLAIDPKYPHERINYMLNDSGCDCLLTDTDQLNQVLSPTVKVLNLTKLPYQRSKDVSHLSIARNNPIACIIYTSGSTGNPKPVMVRHSSIVNLLYNQLKYFHVDTETRLLQFSSISFDASISELWIPLLCHGTLVIPQHKYLSGDILAKIIINKSVTMLIIPPSVLETIQDPAFTAKSLKTIVSAGEALTQATAEKWLPHVENLINAYGPSETTVAASFCYYSQSFCQNNIIGKELEGVTIFILNEDLTKAATGETGEIYIGGAGLSPGYLNHPELNKEKFIKNPFSTGQILYKTGDLARRLADGQIQYVGRRDQQVKVNGIRIELGEIESQLASHPAISSCVIMLEHSQATHGAVLVAYFSLQQANNMMTSIDKLKVAIRQYLLKKLPANMVPHQYKLVESFPRLPSGKIDRKQLATIPSTTLIAANNEAASFSSKIEQDIATLYAEVLKISRNELNTSSDFFELGGSSLDAINVIAKINDKFSVKIALDQFFTDSMICSVAKKVIKDDSTESGSDTLQQLCQIYTSNLGIEIQSLSMTADFFEQGGNSLSAIKVISDIKTAFSIDLAIDDFFEDSSISTINNKFLNETVPPLEKKDLTKELIDQDLFYDLYSLNENPDELLTECPNNQVKNILLTGASGFLGSFLLHSLLEVYPSATIHCLIRPGHNVSCQDKLTNNSISYQLPKLQLNRIKIYQSDLSKVNLGLDNSTYKQLSSTIDSIYHCAAAVNHIQNYQSLRETNVLGTIELLKLALTANKKHFHYISALDISLLQHKNHGFKEQHTHALQQIGYIQSKWVCEYLLEKASALFEFPIHIYRPGNIIGDLKQGLMDPQTNHFLMLTKGCIQLGYAPLAEFLIEMTPVNVVAAAVAKLSKKKASKHLTIHKLHNQHYTSWQHYITLLTQQGYNISLIPADDWSQQHVATIDATNVLFPFKERYSHNSLRLNTGLAELDNNEATKALQALGITYPDNYNKLCHAYFAQLKSANFI